MVPEHFEYRNWPGSHVNHGLITQFNHLSVEEKTRVRPPADGHATIFGKQYVIWRVMLPRHECGDDDSRWREESEERL